MEPVDVNRNFNTDLPRLYNLIKTSRYIAVDTETSGLGVWYDDAFTLSGISFYFPHVNASWYLSFNHGDDELSQASNLDEETFLELRQVWNDYCKDTSIIMFNAKFDRAVMERSGFVMDNIGVEVEDVLLLAQLLNENEERFKLKKLAAKYLGEEGDAGEKDLQAKLKAKGHKKHEMWRLSGDEVAFYAMNDVEITWALRQFYRPHAVRWNVWSLYLDRCKFSNTVLYTMERNGLRVNTELNEKLGKETVQRAEELEQEINRFVSKKIGANVEINPRSPKQLKNAFKNTGTPVSSTNVTTLKGLSDQGNELARLVLDYRHYAKAASSFYKPYQKLQDSNGYVHPNYWATGTVTGRLSCSNPNLQQVPRSDPKNPDSHEVKKVFIPTDGYSIVSVDYAQLELRLGSFYAGCQAMIEMFNNGDDMHQWTADEINRMTGLTLTRHMGKTANFGLIYGMGYKRASQMFGVDEETSKLIVESWHALYPEFRKAGSYAQALASTPRDVSGNRATKGNVKKYRYLRLFNNRVRHFDAIPEQTYTAYNFLVQGTGAVITEQALQRVYDYLAGVNKHEFNLTSVRLLATVHDSAIFEIENTLLPYGKESPIIKKIVDKMQVLPDQPERFGGVSISVPLLVDVKLSKESWYHAD